MVKNTARKNNTAPTFITKNSKNYIEIFSFETFLLFFVAIAIIYIWLEQDSQSFGINPRTTDEVRNQYESN